MDLVLTALLSRGHVLIEDVPGVGKTTLARALGRSLSLDFRRIQFTSDTLPADVLGISVFHAPSERFEFHPGPIFANIVLADEINRATPKTQSALLEAMNEGAVTMESDRRPLPQPFMVVATQNPVEYLGTYPLPESQMDRFLLRLTLGYPRADEEKMLLRRGGAEQALAAIPAVLGPEQVARAPAGDRERRRSRIASSSTSTRSSRATRETADLRLPVSTRGAQALFRAVAGRTRLSRTATTRRPTTPRRSPSRSSRTASSRCLRRLRRGREASARDRGAVPVPVNSESKSKRED